MHYVHVFLYIHYNLSISTYIIVCHVLSEEPYVNSHHGFLFISGIDIQPVILNAKPTLSRDVS